MQLPGVSVGTLSRQLAIPEVQNSADMVGTARIMARPLAAYVRETMPLASLPSAPSTGNWDQLGFGLLPRLALLSLGWR